MLMRHHNVRSYPIQLGVTSGLYGGHWGSHEGYTMVTGPDGPVWVCLSVPTDLVCEVGMSGHTGTCQGTSCEGVFVNHTNFHPIQRKGL